MFRQRRELTESSFKHCKIQRLCLSHSFPLIPSGLESFLPGLSPLGKQGLLAAPNLHPHVSGSTNQILPCLTILGQGGGSSSIGQRVSCATPGRVGTLCYDWQPLQGPRRWWRCKMLLPDERGSDTELAQQWPLGQQLWESQKRRRWKFKGVDVSLPKEERALTKLKGICLFFRQKYP